MPQIETYVFLQIDSTGLPSEEDNETKMTSIALKAVTRNVLAKTALGVMPKCKKLALLINPEREICNKAARISGLTNKKLQNEQTFAQVFPTIKEFFEPLKKPMCLVSHNGDKFTYPILALECAEANVEMPSDLLCVDSLEGFNEILVGTNIDYDTLSSGAAIRKGIHKDYPEYMRLKDLHQRLLGGKQVKGSFNAERHSEILTKCVAAIMKQFNVYANRHCEPFSCFVVEDDD